MKWTRSASLGITVISTFIFIAVFAPLLAPFAPEAIDTEAIKIPPIWAEGGNWKFILGTDDVGRDVLSRLIYGTRFSLGIGVACVGFEPANALISICNPSGRSTELKSKLLAN